MGDEAAQPDGGGADAQRDVAAFVAARDVPCPACGHNLRGSDGAKCPECGVILRLEVSADRLARRSWWIAAVLTGFGVATIFYIALQTWGMVEYFQIMGGFGNSRFIISWAFLIVYLVLGVTSSLFAVASWRGWARCDRRALEVAQARAIGLVAVVGLLFFVTAAMDLVSRLL